MKKRVIILLCAVFSVLMLTACAATVNEPCMYCHDSPSKEYKRSNGKFAYVCKDCSSECMLCGEKATKHYESLIGVVFVCDSCYKEMVNE